MPRRPLLVVGLLLAASASGCGSDNPRLIPQTRAAALTETVDRVGQACDDHDPAKARAAILGQWLTYMQGRVNRDCKRKEEKTPTPSPTAAAPTVTPSPSPSPSPTPTPSATPATPTP